MTEAQSKFWHELNKAALSYSVLEDRIGQAYYQALYSVRPDIARSISETDNDPYFFDKNLPLFFTAITRYLEMDNVRF